MSFFARNLRLMLEVALLCGGIAACSPKDASPAHATRDVTLLTQDGAHIAATLYPVSRPQPAGLILVHMLGSDRSSWESFARAAQRKGYLTIAFDMRSHGGSTGMTGVMTDHRASTRQKWLGVLYDIDAAKQALLDQGADPENLALVGASLGANLALRYAAGHEDIQTVVLLSPGITYQEIETTDVIAAYGRRPLLLMTSTGDTYATASCQTLRTLAKGQCELREYDGSAHGPALFAAASTIPGQILLWLDSIVGPEAARANRAVTPNAPARTPS